MAITYGIAIKSTLRELLKTLRSDYLFDILALPGTRFDGEESQPLNKFFNIENFFNQIVDPTFKTYVTRYNLNLWSKTFKEYCIFHLVKWIFNTFESLLDEDIICGFQPVRDISFAEDCCITLPDDEKSFEKVLSEIKKLELQEDSYSVLYILAIN